MERKQGYRNTGNKTKMEIINSRMEESESEANYWDPEEQMTKRKTIS